MNPDYDDCFKSAFALAISEIEGANDVSVECLFDALKDNSGDLRKQANALIKCLGLSGWKWALYEGPLEKDRDYKKMAELLAFCVEGFAHSLYRREQLSEVAENRPYWKFRAGEYEGTPQSCLDNDGVIKHYQDPFWEDFLPPCGLLCRCRVFALSERDLVRGT